MSEAIYTGPKPPEANIKVPEVTEQTARAWDRAMRRAFKGLVLGGRPAARRALMRSAEVVDDA